LLTKKMSEIVRYIGGGIFALGTIAWISTEFFVPDCETRSLKGAQENLNRAIAKDYIYRTSLPLMLVGCGLYMYGTDMIRLC